MIIDSFTWLYPNYLKLSSLVKTHDNHHGLLLVGDSGIGKRVLAFQLAGDYLDSERLKPKAKAYLTSTLNEYLDSPLFHPDCYFVSPEEKKSSIGIDNIRELKESLNKTSLKGKGKVGIIYPVELMQRSAATSLLKILEEPPDETLLILIAENIHNIPSTIISRVQIHNSKKPSALETIDWLSNENRQKDWQEIITLFGSRPLIINDLGYEFLHKRIRKVSLDLDSLVLKKSKPSEIAAKWPKEDLDMMLKTLYVFITNLISDSMLKENDIVKYLPDSFGDLNSSRLDYELCFNYLNEIANIRHLLLNRKSLNWNLQITHLLTPIYADLNGLIQNG